MILKKEEDKTITYESEFNMNQAELIRLDELLKKIMSVAPKFREAVYSKNINEIILFGKAYLSFLWEYFNFMHKIFEVTKNKDKQEEIKNMLIELENIFFNEKKLKNTGVLELKHKLEDVFRKLDIIRQFAGFGIGIKKRIKEDLDINEYL